MQDRVAVVTGASRGIGKGVALALGRAGACVYVTGRTTHAHKGVGPGSIQETAAAVTQAGGRGVAVQCDHRDDSQVAALFARLEEAEGRLDLLVNNATALHRDLVGAGGFWEKSLDLVDILAVGLRSAYVASYHAARLMIQARQGLIANISFYGAVSYFHGPAYGAQKAGLDKMTMDMAVELAPHGVAAISLWPGFVSTEVILQRRQGEPDFAERMAGYETPDFVGRVVEALSRDPALSALSGQVVIAAEYAQAHGIVETDGRRPPSHRASLGSPAPSRGA